MDQDEEDARQLHEKLKALLDSTCDVGLDQTVDGGSDDNYTMKFLHEKLNALSNEYNSDCGDRDVVESESESKDGKNASDSIDSATIDGLSEDDTIKTPTNEDIPLISLLDPIVLHPSCEDVDCERYLGGNDDDDEDEDIVSKDEAVQKDNSEHETYSSDEEMLREESGTVMVSTHWEKDSEIVYHRQMLNTSNCHENLLWLFEGGAVFPLMLEVSVLGLVLDQESTLVGCRFHFSLTCDGDTAYPVCTNRANISITSPYSSVVLSLSPSAPNVDGCPWNHIVASVEVPLAVVPPLLTNNEIEETHPQWRAWFPVVEGRDGLAQSKVLLSLCFSAAESGLRKPQWRGPKRLLVSVERAEGVPPRTAALATTTDQGSTFACECISCVCTLSSGGLTRSSSPASSVLAQVDKDAVKGASSLPRKAPSNTSGDVAEVLVAKLDLPQKLVLDVKFASKLKGARMVLWPEGDVTATNQKWHFVEGRLFPEHAPNLCLDVKGGRAKVGGAVILWRIKQPKELNQMWRFDEHGHLMSMAELKRGKLSRKLVLGADHLGNGAEVVLVDANSSSAIRWNRGLLQQTIISDSEEDSDISSSDDDDMGGNNIDDTVSALELQIAKARRDGEDEVAAALASDLREVLCGTLPATTKVAYKRKLKPTSRPHKSTGGSHWNEDNGAMPKHNLELPMLTDDEGGTVSWPSLESLMSVDVLDDRDPILLTLAEAGSNRPLTESVALPLCTGCCAPPCTCTSKLTSWRPVSMELPLLCPPQEPLPAKPVQVVIRGCWLHEASASLRSLVVAHNSRDLLHRVSTSESEGDLDDGAAPRLKALHNVAANAQCADCGGASSWASVNIGVFLCIRCAGLHRGLGSHISYVRSIELDSWTMEQVEHMATVGNEKAAKIYEAKLTASAPLHSIEKMRKFISDKYVEKKFASREGVKNLMLTRVGLCIGDQVEVNDQGEDDWSVATVVGMSLDERIVAKLEAYSEAYEWDNWRKLSPQCPDCGAKNSFSCSTCVNCGYVVEDHDGESIIDPLSNYSYPQPAESNEEDDEYSALSDSGESDDGDPQWLLLDNMDSFAGENAFILPFVGLSAAKTLALTRNFEAFAWHRKKAFYREYSAAEVLKHAVASPGCCLHVFTQPPKLQLHIIACAGLHLTPSPDSPDSACSVAYFTDSAFGKSLLKYGGAPKSAEWEYFLAKQTAMTEAGPFPVFEETLNTHLAMGGDYGVFAVMLSSRQGGPAKVHAYSRLPLNLKSLVEGRHWKHELALELRDQRGTHKGVLQLLARWVL